MRRKKSKMVVVVVVVGVCLLSLIVIIFHRGYPRMSQVPIGGIPTMPRGNHVTFLFTQMAAVEVRLLSLNLIFAEERYPRGGKTWSTKRDTRLVWSKCERPRVMIVWAKK